MNAIRLASRAIPATLRRRLVKGHREWTFRRAIAALRRDPDAAAEAGSRVVADLIYGWGNGGWSAGEEYLAACISHALGAGSAILECGSGLTTIVLGIIAAKRGIRVWTLEHSADWAQIVRQRLAALRVASVEICECPLSQYADFDWYAPPLDAMPCDFALVVCDGPPSTTRGGRFGLVPVMGSRLAPGAVILLDDASRAPERSAAGRWASTLNTHYEILGAARPFIRMTASVRPTAPTHVLPSPTQ